MTGRGYSLTLCTRGTLLKIALQNGCRGEHDHAPALPKQGGLWKTAHSHLHIVAWLGVCITKNQFSTLRSALLSTQGLVAVNNIATQQRVFQLIYRRFCATKASFDMAK